MQEGKTYPLPNRQKPSNYLSKVKSPTGKVHYAQLTHKDKGVEFYDPHCNHRNWLGDYWGKKWVPVSDDVEVTCKNCLSARGESMFKAEITLFTDEKERVVYREFKTKAEMNAYLEGLREGRSWRFIRDLKGKPI